MKALKTLLAIFVCISWINLRSSEKDFRVPAEFEPQESVYFGWPINFYKEEKVFPQIFAILNTLIPVAKVHIPMNSQEEINEVKHKLKIVGFDVNKISFEIYPYPHALHWWRDYGPIVMVNDKGKRRVVDLNFNLWSHRSNSYPLSRMLERIDRDWAKRNKLPWVTTRVVSEGGNLEFNGNGTLICVEDAVIAHNPNLSKQEIEDEFKRIFNVKKIIWLKQGLIENSNPKNRLPLADGSIGAYSVGGTGGHVNEFCRFVDSGTILLAEITENEAADNPIASENYKRLELNYEILKNATDQDGRSFLIVRVPVPPVRYAKLTPQDPLYESLARVTFSDGSAFPYGQSITVVPSASYCNFLICNKVVLMQKYWKPGMPQEIKNKDEIALKIFKHLFPNKDVVPIYAMPINMGGGGIHSCTRNIPAASKEKRKKIADRFNLIAL
jgi:agmatine deiminase